MTARSLTRHPAFRPLLAIWFALLIGGGLFVLPTAFHQDTLASLGIVLPDAVPPRLPLALAGALVGALLGLAMGARLAPAAAEEPWYPDEGFAHATAGAEDADAPVAPPADPAPAGRRRVLNLREEFGEDGFGDEQDDRSGVLDPADDPLADWDGPPAIVTQDWAARDPELAADAEPDREADAADAPVYELSSGDDADWDAADTGADTDTGTGGAATGWSAPAPAAALGDLSLGELTARLHAAMAQAQGSDAPAGGAPAYAMDDDAFEAAPSPAYAEPAPQHAAPPAPEPLGEDNSPAEQALRSALDRLNRARQG